MSASQEESVHSRHFFQVVADQHIGIGGILFDCAGQRGAGFRPYVTAARFQFSLKDAAGYGGFGGDYRDSTSRSGACRGVHTGVHHPPHRHGEGEAQPGQGNGGDGIARYHDALRTLFTEEPGDFVSETADFGRCSAPVRQARAVRQIQEIPIRQAPPQRFQDSQTTDSGIEDADHVPVKGTRRAMR